MKVMYNFKRFPVEFEFKSLHYIDSSPCVVYYVVYMFMPCTVS